MYPLMTSMQAELDYRRARITEDYPPTHTHARRVHGRRWHRKSPAQR
jgi:hypothetical protein